MATIVSSHNSTTATINLIHSLRELGNHPNTLSKLLMASLPGQQIIAELVRWKIRVWGAPRRPHNDATPISWFRRSSAAIAWVGHRSPRSGRRRNKQADQDRNDGN